MVFNVFAANDDSFENDRSEKTRDFTRKKTKRDQKKLEDKLNADRWAKNRPRKDDDDCDSCKTDDDELEIEKSFDDDFDEGDDFDGDDFEGLDFDDQDDFLR